MFYGYRWYDEFRRTISTTGSHDIDSFEMYRRIISPTFELAVLSQLVAHPSGDDVEPGGALFRRRLGTERLAPEDLGILDALSFLVDDNLVRVDIASMAHSLEVRVPYLDDQLVTFLAQLPHDQLVKNGVHKHLLRSVATHRLPKATLEKPKSGFSTPTIAWLRGDWTANLLDGFAVRDGLFDRSALERILESEPHEARIWLLYVFEKWYGAAGPLEH